MESVQIGIAHPGLLTLWNKGAEEVRWQVFAAAVSPHLNPKLLSQLPAHLVVLASTLTYLHHELENRVLEPWEIEVLIVQAVVLQEYDADRLSKLQVSNVHVRAIRISTLFMRSTNNIQFLLATCGYPVTVIEAMPYKYFDGKLFNSLYHKMKLGAKYEDECFQKVALMEQFLKVRQLVLGSLHS